MAFELDDAYLHCQHLHDEILDRTEATQDGINVSACCDKLETLLTNTEGELSPLSVESIKLAIQAIYSNVGATYSLESYAGTNFKQIALEDVSGFVKELWARVKTSIQTLWDKVTQFWEDNFSALQSTRKSLEQAIAVVQKDYKVTERRQAMRLPDALFTAFNTKKDIDDVLVGSFIVTHLGNFDRLDEVVNRTKYFNQHVRVMRRDEFTRDVDAHLISIANNLTSRVFKFGMDVRPMIGGDYLSVEYNFEDGSSEMTVDINKSTLPVDMENREIYITDHSKLKNLLKKTLDVIDETIKYASVREKAQKEFDDLIHTYDKIVLEGDPVINKNVNKTIRLIYKINSCMPGFFSLVVSSNVKLAKAVLGYASLCVKEA